MTTLLRSSFLGESIRWFSGEKISKIHGQARQFGRHMVMPMYHPAAALRSPAVRTQIEADFARLPSTVEAAEKSRHKLSESHQLEESLLDQLKLF